MASQAERDAQSLKETFDGLTESIRKSAETSGKLRQTFLDLSSTANASGQAWTVISRLTSGTGFWKIQNRIRAISNFFQFQEKRLNEQVSREQEQIKLIKDQINEREKLAKAQQVVNKISKNTATLQERQAFFQSDQLKYYEILFGRQTAVTKVTEKLKIAQENLNKVQGFRGENRARMMQKEFENDENLKYRQKLFTTATGQRTLFSKFLGNLYPQGSQFQTSSLKGTQAGFFRQMRDEEKTSYANFSDSIQRRESLKGDKKILEGRLKSMEQEIIDKKRLYEDEMMAEDMGISEANRMDSFELERLKDDIKELMSEQRELLEEQVSLEEDKKNNEKDIKKERKALKDAGIKVSNRKGKTKITDVENPKTGAEYLISLYKKTALYKISSGIMKGVKDIPFGSIFKSLGIFLKSFLFYGSLIVLAVYLLKQSGILDKLFEFFGFVFLYLYEIYQSVVQFFSTFFVFISNIVSFISATLFGSEDDQKEALKTIGESLMTFLIDGIGGVLSAVIGGIFTTVFLGGLQVLAGAISKSFGEEIQNLRTYLEEKGGAISSVGGGLGATYGGFKGMKAGAALGGRLGMVAGPKGVLVGTILGGIFGMLGGSALGGGIGSAIGQGIEKLIGFEPEGKFMGGVIAGKAVARYLVGERGPELVDLPAGSYVNSNTRTRAMLSAGLGMGGGDTINIYINGRIGASETELRDIGNRLGDIINNRGNRVGNTRMFR